MMSDAVEQLLVPASAAPAPSGRSQQLSSARYIFMPGDSYWHLQECINKKALFSSNGLSPPPIFKYSQRRHLPPPQRLAQHPTASTGFLACGG